MGALMSEVIATSIQAPVQGDAEQAPEASIEQPKVDPNKARLMHLAKQQKMLRSEQVKFKAEQEAWKKEQEQRKSDYENNYVPKSRLKENAVQALLDAGVSADELTSSLINQPSPQDLELRELKAKLAALQADTDSIKNSSKEREDSQYQQVRSQMLNEAKIFVNSNQTDYELINKYGAQEAVIEYIEQIFHGVDQETGEAIDHPYAKAVMPIEEAAKEVEEYLLEQAIDLVKAKKVMSKINPAPPPAPAKGVPPRRGSGPTITTKAPPPINTLTHQTIPATTTKGTTEKDRRSRAILAFQKRL